jgi:protein-serine/threonine kinase
VSGLIVYITAIGLTGSVDNGDEVKFVVELCRMRNLPGLYHLTIKRLRGDVWSFKFIYQTVLE